MEVLYNVVANFLVYYANYSDTGLRNVSLVRYQKRNYYSVDIVGTVYHLVIYMQSNKVHRVFQ